MDFKLKNKEKLVTLAGVVVTRAWDRQGRAVEFFLATHDERNLAILGDFTVDEIGRWLQEMVLVTGAFCQTQQGEEAIRVRDIKPVAKRPRRALHAGAIGPLTGKQSENGMFPPEATEK